MMSRATTRIPPSPSPEPVFRLSVDQYHTMIDAGVLTDDDPVELLEGILVFKMPKKPAHRLALRKLASAIEAILPSGFFLQVQEPITLDTGEPEPDAAVVRGAEDDYAERHPGADDVPLVVEVADTTLARDRGIKLRSYAAAGIPIYWIVDLVGRSVEVYTEPNHDQAHPAYNHVRVFHEHESAPLVLFGKEIGQIPVARVLQRLRPGAA
jgi:Uma2 family endonuclease